MKISIDDAMADAERHFRETVPPRREHHKHNGSGHSEHAKHNENRGGYHRAEGHAERQDANWPEPDWSILNDRRGVLADFPTDTLDPPVRDYIDRAARGAGVTFDHVAGPLIAVASGLIGTARRVQPSRGWSEPMPIWFGLIGYSGSGKTPGLGVAKRALAEVDRLRKDKIADLERQHDTKAETAIHP